MQANWREALRILDRQVRPTDTVAFPNTFYRITAEDYAPAVPPPWWLSTRAALPAVPWGSLGPYELDRIIRLRLEQSPSTIRAELAGAPRVWLVGPADSEFNTAVTVLCELGYVEHVESGVVIALFDAPG